MKEGEGMWGKFLKRLTGTCSLKNINMTPFLPGRGIDGGLTTASSIDLSALSANSTFNHV